MITETINFGYFVIAIEFMSLYLASLLKNKKAVFLLLAFIAATVLIFFA